MVRAEKYGQKLFEQNCLSCHSPGGYAQRFNFTSKLRILPIRKQLIDSIVSKAMPPLQFAVGDGYAEMTGLAKHLSDSQRSAIVEWLNNLEMDSQKYSELQYIAPQLPPIQPPTTRSDIKAASILRIKDNIKFISQYSSGREQTSIYKIEFSSNYELGSLHSLVGYKVNSGSSVHHFQIANENYFNSKYKLISWVPFYPKLTIFPPGSELQINFQKPMFLIKHSAFISDSKVLNDDLSVELLLTPKTSESRYQAIGFNSSVFSLVLKNTSIKYTCFDNRTEISFLSPHMHAGGESLDVKHYKPLLEKELNIAKFYGWTDSMQDRYYLTKSIIIQPKDCLKITCHFKPDYAVQSLGWESSEEMCALNLQIK